MVVKLSNGRYAKDCPECGKQQTYLRKNYAECSLRERKVCKSCSNKKTENCKRQLHKCVNITWFKKFETNANLRGIDWDITLDDIFQIYKNQNRVCALSGWQVGWAEVGQKHTASIDRIDSKLGYTKQNVQIVHKMINMMKQQYSQSDFINACKAVAKNN